MSDFEFHTTSLIRSSYYFLILLLIISYAFYYLFNSTYHELTTTTHFQVNTTKNILSYNLTVTLSLPDNNFPNLGLRLVSIETIPTIYTIRRRGSSIFKSPPFNGLEDVSWVGWNTVICNFSNEEKIYYRKEPLREYFVLIEVYLQSNFNLNGFMVPWRSTAECMVELPMSTSTNGVYGGVYGPTKCG